MTTKEQTCAERIAGAWARTKEDLLSYMGDGAVYESGSEDGARPFNEYALSFDYVAPGTFSDQPKGYWRYQMSWGGPSDEIRFFGGPVHFTKAEYWFMDWYDGAKLDVADERVAHWLWNELRENGAVMATFNEAQED
ncbi:hypothetical protein [Rhodoferax sp.]|uniref:hypothetical protein n=1 Tax=Rhodoferax sp. TaxID=50421 RepID=UPI00275C3072|nr:hypothetical protein [Rhodoferax sp.]